MSKWIPCQSCGCVIGSDDYCFWSGHNPICETCRAQELFNDGEISLASLGETLLEKGHTARQVRLMLSKQVKYPIPANYFGQE